MMNKKNSGIRGRGGARRKIEGAGGARQRVCLRRDGRDEVQNERGRAWTGYI
jgi:hypothetical protein